MVILQAVAIDGAHRGNVLGPAPGLRWCDARARVTTGERVAILGKKRGG